ncbi:hypothetical protein bthur0012_9820 [Bacillus thuringiensis serovar pulsiensis BGSC 4CC1]|nr:hypothetical protein bthur0012_9820 [Bacillus thuringiensis serovar pulsiensis BGSC 4CC1]
MKMYKAIIFGCYKLLKLKGMGLQLPFKMKNTLFFPMSLQKE